MAKQEYSSAENFLKNLMGILALIFLVCFLIFALAPDGLIKVLNVIGDKIFGLEPARLVSEFPEHANFRFVPQRLWLILALSLMATITYLSYLVWRNPRKNLPLVPVILLSKLTSSLVALIYFFAQQNYFVNLVAFITDFPIFLVVLFAYLRVVIQKEKELVS